MAYSASQTVLRADINVMVEEAMERDSWFIGQRAFPLFSVSEKSGTYPVFKKAKGQLLNLNAAVRTPGGNYPRITRSYEYDTYDCQDRGIEELVDDTYAKDVARFFAAEQVAGRQCMSQMLMDHDYRVSAEIFATGNWGAGTAAVVAYTMANIATIDFPQDVLARVEALRALGVQANTIILSAAVWVRLVQSTKFQAWMRGSRPSDATLQITPEMAADSFSEHGISQVLVGRSIYNSAKQGQTFSGANIWGNTYVWVGKCNGGDFAEAGAGRTLVWNAEGGHLVTETYREEAIRSNVVRVRTNTDEKVVDTNAGRLITTSYA